MRFIEPFEHAPEWAQKLAMVQIERFADSEKHPVTTPRGIAFFRTYDRITEGVDRERRWEMEAMLRGLVGDLEAHVSEFTGTGSDFYKLDVGFPAVGANFQHLFRMIIV